MTVCVDTVIALGMCVCLPVCFLVRPDWLAWLPAVLLGDVCWGTSVRPQADNQACLPSSGPFVWLSVWLSGWLSGWLALGGVSTLFLVPYVLLWVAAVSRLFPRMQCYWWGQPVGLCPFELTQSGVVGLTVTHSCQRVWLKVWFVGTRWC
jgi:hypothetical protein